jgi:hypothetical protein
LAVDIPSGLNLVTGYIYHNRCNEEVLRIPCCSFRSNSVSEDFEEANTLEISVGSANVVAKSAESDDSNNET